MHVLIHAVCDLFWRVQQLEVGFSGLTGENTFIAMTNNKKRHMRPIAYQDVTIKVMHTASAAYSNYSHLMTVKSMFGVLTRTLTVH
jgi:hypothetical protein